MFDLMLMLINAIKVKKLTNWSEILIHPPLNISNNIHLLLVPSKYSIIFWEYPNICLDAHAPNKLLKVILVINFTQNNYVVFPSFGVCCFVSTKLVSGAGKRGCWNVLLFGVCKPGRWSVVSVGINQGVEASFQWSLENLGSWSFLLM